MSACRPAHPACVHVCKLFLVPRSVSCVLPSSLLPFLSPTPLAFSLSVSVFLFSRKSVRGKGKGQKRKRKKSRYKSWSAYVGPPLSRFPEPPQPPIKLPPAGPWNPASLLLPFPGSRPPSSLVSLSHSHSTNWHRWVDVVAALLVQGWGWAGGQSGPGGFREGPLAWLGTAFPSPTGHWWRAHVGTGAGR